MGSPRSQLNSVLSFRVISWIASLTCLGEPIHEVTRNKIVREATLDHGNELKPRLGLRVYAEDSALEFNEVRI
jgi:hypothetical protein